jgi:hypothetical protein
LHWQPAFLCLSHNDGVSDGSGSRDHSSVSVAAITVQTAQRGSRSLARPARAVSVAVANNAIKVAMDSFVKQRAKLSRFRG